METWKVEIQKRKVQRAPLRQEQTKIISKINPARSTRSTRNDRSMHRSQWKLEGTGNSTHKESQTMGR